MLLACSLVVASAYSINKHHEHNKSKRNLAVTVDPPGYASTLRCGDCINTGYRYCHKTGSAHAIVTTFDNTTTNDGACCRDSDWCYDYDTDWTCSVWYNNSLYSKWSCPYPTDSCGSAGVSNITLDSTSGNATASIQVSTPRGELCAYKITTNGKVPKFTITTGASVSELLIEFIEYQDDAISIGTGNSSQYLAGDIAFGLPYRDETFNYDSDRMVFQGRWDFASGDHYWGSLTEGAVPTIKGTAS